MTIFEMTFHQIVNKETNRQIRNMPKGTIRRMVNKSVYLPNTHLFNADKKSY